jgi:demethylmenaquinone methyltransferase/2-methoxy-6-polyprenyl-1,4-benzoquinol methylase
VRQLFDRLAAGYDLRNTLFSLGRDRAWRKRAAALCHLRPGQRAIDLCTGTGRLAAELKQRVGPNGQVVGVDFAPAMIGKARSLFPDVVFKEGDVTALAEPDQSFDAATIAFGLRNVIDRQAALREAARVLRPNGRFVILEFTPSHAPGVPLPYRFYLERVMPLIAGSGYRYLAESIRSFPSPTELTEMLLAAGFKDVSCRMMTFNIVTFFVGTG